MGCIWSEVLIGLSIMVKASWQEAYNSFCVQSEVLYDLYFFFMVGTRAGVEPGLLG